jgi:hypothetical protein
VTNPSVRRLFFSQVIEGDDPEKLFLNIQCLSKVIRIFFESLFAFDWPRYVTIFITRKIEP